MIDTSAIKVRAEAATPGPWTTDINGTGTNQLICCPEAGGKHGNRGYVMSMALTDRNAKNDADFVSHARTDIPALLDALEEAQHNAQEADGAYRAVLAEKDRLLERVKEAEARCKAMERAMRQEMDYCNTCECVSSKDWCQNGICPSIEDHYEFDQARFSAKDGEGDEL